MLAKIWQKIVERLGFIFVPFGRVAYGQNAEDIVLAKFLDDRLKNQQKGFYIDIGAHHPFRYSNTYYFYKKGWKGLNIDADEKAIQLFKLFRRKDINVQALVAKQSKTLSYYVFTDRAFNTCDFQLAKAIIKKKRAQLIEKKELRSQKLQNILDKYLQPGQKIDFLSIDVEGMDDELLQAFDFVNFAPSYLLIEDLDFINNKSNQNSKKIARFLKKQGYVFVSQIFNTAIWQKKALN
jgi:hypothetical protein